MKICPKCGCENTDKARFCNECGAALMESLAEPEKEKTHGGSGEEITTKDDTEETSNEKTIKAAEDLNFDVQKEEETESGNESRKKSRKKPVIAVIGVLAAVLIVFALIRVSSTPKLEKIAVKYDGSTEAGTILDEKNEGFTVTGTYSDDTTEKMTDWTIEDPQTLQMDQTVTVTITCEGLSTDLEISCSTSELTGIRASYSGKTEAGTKIDADNAGIVVIASYKNGDEEYVGDWEIENPGTLNADETSSYTVTYEGMSAEFSVKCTTSVCTGISAVYSGDTEEGTKIDAGDSDVSVTAEYKDGTKKRVYDWTVKKAVTLEAGETSKLEIEYEDQSCTLEIKCTSETPEDFKDSCESISYDNLARNPDDYLMKRIKFYGRVVQVVEGSSGSLVLRVNVTNDGYGYYDDTVYVYYTYKTGESHILEDDMINMYGYSGGLYTYETVMGNNITIPLLYAEYIDVQ